MGRGLLVRYVAGDCAAFKEISKRMRGEVLSVIKRFFHERADQEEALQEVWLHLYRMRGHFDPDRHEAFASWLRQVARNRCLDLVKARGRRPEIVVELADAAAEPLQPEAVARVRLQEALTRVLEGLDAEQQTFFVLCFAEELSHEEIATRMSIPPRRSKYLKKKLVSRLVGDRQLCGLLQGPAGCR